MKFLDILSMLSDIVSIVLGVGAIFLSNAAERRSKKNFEQVLKINALINRKLNLVDEELEDVLAKEKI